MSNKCCIPKCKSKRPQSLYGVPAKRFRGGDEYIWADNLEKRIRSLRKDEKLDLLYLKDQVKICAKHFPETSFYQKEGESDTKYLKLGEIPTLNLAKDIKIPKERPYKDRNEKSIKKPPKLLYACYDDFVNVLKKRKLPKVWNFSIENEMVHLRKRSNYVQYEYDLFINRNLEIAVHFFGWNISVEQSKFDIMHTSISNLLKQVSKINICVGVGSECSQDANVAHHFKMEQPTPFQNKSGIRNELIAYRAVNCGMVCDQEEDRCSDCKKIVKIHTKRIMNKIYYEKKKGNKPLQTLKVKNVLQSRISITLNLQKQRLDQCKKRIDELLQNKEKLVTVNERLAEDLESMMKKPIGITNSNISSLLAHFATTGASALELTTVVLKILSMLYLISNLNCLAVIGDGLRANRQLFLNLSETPANEDLTGITTHPMDPEQPLFMISDPSHLIKTARNNLHASRSGGTRLMWKHDQYLTWNQIEKIYESRSLDPSSLTRLHRITHRHIHLSNLDKMKVNLAMDMFSIDMIEVAKDNGFTELATFITNVKKFMDITNATLHHSNPERAPFKDLNDPRLQWLETGFPEYLDSWETSAKGRKKRNGTKFLPHETQKMLLSKETLSGLKFTSNALAGLIKHMLKKGNIYVVPKRLSQDILEGFFGQVRGRGGYHGNPNYKEFIDRAHSINVTKKIKHT